MLQSTDVVLLVLPPVVELVVLPSVVVLVVLPSVVVLVVVVLVGQSGWIPG